MNRYRRLLVLSCLRSAAEEDRRKPTRHRDLVGLALDYGRSYRVKRAECEELLGMKLVDILARDG